jgi:phosphoribulokinase
MPVEVEVDSTHLNFINYKKFKNIFIIIFPILITLLKGSLSSPVTTWEVPGRS